MNSSGVQRGYMARNMKPEEFLKVVLAAIAREFEKEVKLEKTNDNEIIITLDNYKVTISNEIIKKHKTPYGLDRFILEAFEKQGFTFDRYRSQYIRNCFGKCS